MGDLPISTEELLRRFDHPSIHAFVLTGSYARGDAGPYSDIDLLRFVADDVSQPDGAGSHLIDGWLVNISNVVSAEIERWFTEPEVAVNVIAGVRVAQALVDPDGYFAAIQDRARSFIWDDAMQQRADRWASKEMVGWIEEAHKAMEGLRRNDVGRLLNARHGCSWGMTSVVQVQRGILLSGDNAIYDEIEAAVGPHTEWVRLRRTAFGVEDEAGHAPTLRDQVTAGLQLYAVTAEMIATARQPQDEPLVMETVERIRRFLDRYGADRKG